MPTDPQQIRKEECRREVLCYLVERVALAFPAHAIARKLRIDGNDFCLQEVEEALEVLAGFPPDPLVKLRADPLGSTRYYQATTAGVLFHERS